MVKFIIGIPVMIVSLELATYCYCKKFRINTLAENITHGVILLFCVSALITVIYQFLLTYIVAFINLIAQVFI